VAEILDGEVSSDELQQSTSLMYDVIYALDFANGGSESSQKRYSTVHWF